MLFILRETGSERNGYGLHVSFFQIINPFMFFILRETGSERNGYGLLVFFSKL